MKTTNAHLCLNKHRINFSDKYVIIKNRLQDVLSIGVISEFKACNSSCLQFDASVDRKFLAENGNKASRKLPLLRVFGLHRGGVLKTRTHSRTSFQNRSDLDIKFTPWCHILLQDAHAFKYEFRQETKFERKIKKMEKFRKTWRQMTLHVVVADYNPTNNRQANLY